MVPSVVESVLIPAAGVVAYRTAAGKSSSATGAVAAGGLALYAWAGSTMPASRVEAYGRGSKALSCALGKYRVAEATSSVDYVARAEFGRLVKAFRKTFVNVADAMEYVDAIDAQVRQQSVTGLIDAQLDDFTSATVEEINILLEGTIPPLGNLADQISTLGNAFPKPKLADPATFAVPDVSDAVSKINKAADALFKSDVGSRPSVDLSSCLISTAALVAQGLFKPLSLGEGNSDSGQTRDLTSQGLTIAITGGQVPYSHVVGGDPVNGRPKVEISMQGVTVLNITKSAESKVEERYSITVFDALGSKRIVNVRIAE
jgi:hypothetical protein